MFPVGEEAWCLFGESNICFSSVLAGWASECDETCTYSLAVPDWIFLGSGMRNVHTLSDNRAKSFTRIYLRCDLGTWYTDNVRSQRLKDRFEEFVCTSRGTISTIR